MVTEEPPKTDDLSFGRSSVRAVVELYLRLEVSGYNMDATRYEEEYNVLFRGMFPLRCGCNIMKSIFGAVGDEERLISAKAEDRAVTKWQPHVPQLRQGPHAASAACQMLT